MSSHVRKLITSISHRRYLIRIVPRSLANIKIQQELQMPPHSRSSYPHARPMLPMLVASLTFNANRAPVVASRELRICMQHRPLLSCWSCHRSCQFQPISPSARPPNEGKCSLVMEIYNTGQPHISTQRNTPRWLPTLVFKRWWAAKSNK